MERARFRVLLQQSREQRQRWELIESFGEFVEQGRQSGLLETFHTAPDQPLEQHRDEAGRLGQVCCVFQHQNKILLC